MAKKKTAGGSRQSGIRGVAPHLCVRGAAEAIAFYKAAFAAKEVSRTMGPNSNAILHAEIRLGEFTVYLNDEFPDHGALSPLARGGTAVTIHLAVRDADKAFEKAVSAGAKVVMPLQDQFWGDRYGMLEDPFGHRWSIGAPIRKTGGKRATKKAKKFFDENPDWPKKMRA